MKAILVVFIISFSFLFCFPEEKIIIGVSSPFLRSQEVNSFFYHSQFIFELLSNTTDERYSFEVLNIEMNENEADYMQICKEEAQKNKFDYILYSEVYVIKDFLYFKVILKNPYTDVVLFVELFSEKNDYYVNEALTNNVKSVVNKINESDIQKVKNKKGFLQQPKKNEGEISLEVPENSKHEVFIMNGFFKNNPGVMSLFSWYVGYDFTPFSFFSIETAIFWGAGYPEDGFNITEKLFSNFYLGTYGAFHLFLPGIVEPGVGMRVEIGYLFNQTGFLSLPVDLGIKIAMTKKNIFRINASFQYIYFNLNDSAWKNNFIIGFMVGYAWKI